MVSTIRSFKLVGSFEEFQVDPHGSRRELEKGHRDESHDMVLDQLELVDRRMQSLARALNCLGHFDDGDDAPDAA